MFTLNPKLSVFACHRIAMEHGVSMVLDNGAKASNPPIVINTLQEFNEIAEARGNEQQSKTY